MTDHTSVPLGGVRKPSRGRERKQIKFTKVLDRHFRLVYHLGVKQFHETEQIMEVIEWGLVTVAVVCGAILALVVICDLVAEVWENKGE